MSEFLHLSEKEKNITLNALYHDYGLSEDAIEAFDRAWKNNQSKKNSETGDKNE